MKNSSKSKLSKSKLKENEQKSAIFKDETEVPWLDYHLSEEAMNHLWNFINNKRSEHIDAQDQLAGNISKSYYIPEIKKDNWFYENVLKRCTETLHFRNWNMYYSVHISKIIPPPVFILRELWVNHQKQHEFNPPHVHTADYSFVVFMKIPTHWKEQHALPMIANSNSPCASDFQFLLSVGIRTGPVAEVNLSLCPDDEGRILFFPSWLSHQVFPFFNSEEERITISGNIVQQFPEG